MTFPSDKILDVYKKLQLFDLPTFYCNNIYAIAIVKIDKWMGLTSELLFSFSVKDWYFVPTTTC